MHRSTYKASLTMWSINFASIVMCSLVPIHMTLFCIHNNRPIVVLRLLILSSYVATELKNQYILISMLIPIYVGIYAFSMNISYIKFAV